MAWWRCAALTLQRRSTSRRWMTTSTSAATSAQGWVTQATGNSIRSESPSPAAAGEGLGRGNSGGRPHAVAKDRNALAAGRFAVNIQLSRANHEVHMGIAAVH